MHCELTGTNRCAKTLAAPHWGKRPEIVLPVSTLAKGKNRVYPQRMTLVNSRLLKQVPRASPKSNYLEARALESTGLAAFGRALRKSRPLWPFSGIFSVFRGNFFPTFLHFRLRDLIGFPYFCHLLINLII